MNIRKYIRRFLFSKQEKEMLTDCYAYLSQLEDNWKNPSNSCNQFCLDVALKRKFLIDLCPNAFDKDIDKHIDNEIWDHVREGRYNKDSNKDIVKPMLEKYNGKGINFDEEIDCCGCLKIRF